MRYWRLSTTPSRGEFTAGSTCTCFVNKDLIGEKPTETILCNIVPGIRPLPLRNSFISSICSFLVGLSIWKSRHHNDKVLLVTNDMTSSILTARTRAVWWDRFGNPTVRFIVEGWTLSIRFYCPALSLYISRLYKRDGNPKVFPKCALTYVAKAGYGQPTETKAYMARRHAFTRLSIWTTHDILDVNIVPGIFRHLLFCVHQDSRTGIWWRDFCWISDNYFRNFKT